MLRLHKRSLRIAFLIIPLLSLGVVLPQFSSIGAAGLRQDEKHASSPLPSAEAAAKQGFLEDNSEISTITLEPPGKAAQKGQLVRPNVALGAAVIKEVEPNNTSATATPIPGASAKIRGNIFPV